MFSIRKLFGKEEKFFDLLEASAEEAKISSGLLARFLQAKARAGELKSVDEFVHSRRKDKRITQQITEELCRTFVTPLEREDIEALAFALYRIPKMSEKIVERLAIYPGRLPAAGLLRQAELLQLAADNVAFMVGELRKGAKMDRIREANEKLQFAEGEADKVMLQVESELYQGPYEAKEVIFLLQLFEMVEKAVDRCRDAGNVVFQIMLKYS
jgi:uncharacterized protein Yka (UPF0111/DUF47 family)